MKPQLTPPGLTLHITSPSCAFCEAATMHATCHIYLMGSLCHTQHIYVDSNIESYTHTHVCQPLNLSVTLSSTLAPLVWERCSLDKVQIKNSRHTSE